MAFFIVFLALLITIVLNCVFAKKIKNKTYMVCMGLLNVAFSLAFVILLVVVGTVKKNLSSYIDLGIKQIEMRVDEICPGALEKQMSTEEVKKLLESSLERKDVNGLESLAENIIKFKIQNFTSSTLKAIKALERDVDKLSIKDALVSIKELSVSSVEPWFIVLEILIIVLYVILIVASALLSLHFANDKDSNNKGVVFGEEADKTFIGMENK